MKNTTLDSILND